MRTIFLLLLLFAAGAVGFQKAPATRKVALIDKIIDTIHSTILNENRFIWVRIPEAARNVSSKKYPVMFLFDAEANFDATKNILEKLSTQSGTKTEGAVILVGIGNIWLRYRDYSPSHIDSSSWIDAPTAKTTGGGEAFIAFLEKELLPHIEKKYPASSHRTLIGHSMGGLMVINILLKHQQLFDKYIAIDPSMWWDNNKLLNESVTILHDNIFENKSLFLAVANEPEKQMSMDQVKSDTSIKTVLIRPSFLLKDLILKNKQDKLRFEWKFYKDEHHMTVNAPATYDALKIILH